MKDKETIKDVLQRFRSDIKPLLTPKDERYTPSFGNSNVRSNLATSKEIENERKLYSERKQRVCRTSYPMPKEKVKRLIRVNLPQVSDVVQTSNPDKLAAGANIPQPIEVYSKRSIPNGIGRIEKQTETRTLENPARNSLSDFYRQLPDKENGLIEAKRYAKALNHADNKTQLKARMAYVQMLRSSNVCPHCYLALRGHKQTGLLTGVQDIADIDAAREFIRKCENRRIDRIEKGRPIKIGEYPYLYEHTFRDFGEWYADIKSHWYIFTEDGFVKFAFQSAYRTTERCICIK